MDDQNQNAQTQASEPVSVPVNNDSQQLPAQEPMQETQQAPEDEEAVNAIREQAVASLLPVIDSVQGTPEHKFELLMNALQTTSNPTLLQKALEAAQAIEDPSIKAEALVDLLNETNAI